MAAASFPNVYTRRLVADSAAKGCDICYKPSTTVLVTPEKQDFFYVCPIHLKDKNFCTPIVDQAAIEAKKKKELEEELERVKKEYEEKQKRKKDKEKEKEKEKEEEGKDKDNTAEDRDKDKQKEGTEEKKDESSTKDKAEKVDESSTPAADQEPRVFALQRNFYAGRVDKKRQAEAARRNRERLQNPNFFPSVPKGLP